MSINAVRLKDKINQNVCSKTEPMKTLKVRDVGRVYQFSNGTLKGRVKLDYKTILTVHYDSNLRAWTY
jgi:hypothetical protein